MKLYDEREEELGEELMRALERYLLLQIIDQRWREHLYDMDYLREGIHLRGFAQIEPIVAYKNEAFTLFQDLMNTIWADFARMIYNVEVEIEGENGGGAVPPQQPAAAAASARSQYSGGTMEDQPSAYGGDEEGDGARREGEPCTGRAAAPRRRERAARPQRPVLVRVGQEVQEVPRGVAAPTASRSSARHSAPTTLRVELRARVALAARRSRTPARRAAGTGGRRSSPRTRRRRG